MTRWREVLLDRWTPLSHKQPLGDARHGGQRDGASWLPPEDRRRLTAYKVLVAYTSNAARLFLDTDADDLRDDHREYGDPHLIVQQSLSAVLGEEQHLVVAGAADFDPDFEPDPEVVDPAPLVGAEEPLTPQPEQSQVDNEAAGRAAEREEWLRDWATAEQLPLKILECENDAVGLGDGVYLLAWSPTKKRVRVSVVDPGFYFPVLPEGLTDDYPTRVHFAWELPGDPLRNISPRLRRVTYEVRPIGYETELQPDDRGRLRRLLRIGDDGGLTLADGDRQDSTTGQITREYAWSTERSSSTCYLTDAEWTLDSLDAKDTLDDLDPSKATFAVNEQGDLLDSFDLRMDFLPVIHVPNTVALRQHFGQSSLAMVLQVLDDLAGTDTDLQRAGATTGSPPIWIAGVTDKNETRTIGPGEVWNVGPEGRVGTLDTSASLQALSELDERLLKRLSANARLPEAVLGRVNPSDVPSGYAVKLTFGPLQSMVRSMRLSRSVKYPLMLKFVQRLALGGGELTGEVLDADLEFGSYLPSDTEGVIQMVTQLRSTSPPSISLRTAVTWLREVGVPIEDVAEEVAAIESRAFSEANSLADVVDDPQVVYDFLGLKGTPVEPPPIPIPPPLPVPPEVVPTP